MNGSDLSPRRKIFGRFSVVAGNSVQIAGLVTAYLSLSSSQSAHSHIAAVVAMVGGWVLLYFCCHAIAHWVVGRILGIRFSFYTVGGTGIPEGCAPRFRCYFRKPPSLPR